MVFSLKMRASENGRHISGAERILDEQNLKAAVAALTERALGHAKGKPDEIHLKMERVHEVIEEIPALPVSTVEVKTPNKGLSFMENFLKKRGIRRAAEVVQLLTETSDMRGAILLDPETMTRLEADKDRGIRATYMDYKEQPKVPSCGKQHFREALALATKVVHAPGIFAELCISDDPDYVTGYVATKEAGYVRVTRLKEMGSPKGARIFLYTGTPEEIPACIDYLQNKKVWIVEKRA